MGRGRRGIVTTSMRKAVSIGTSHGNVKVEELPFRLEDLELFRILLSQENERSLTKILEATVYLAAQPSTPHERSLAWGHQTNST